MFEASRADCVKAAHQREFKSVTIPTIFPSERLIFHPSPLWPGQRPLPVQRCYDYAISLNHLVPSITLPVSKHTNCTQTDRQRKQLKYQLFTRVLKYFWFRGTVEIKFIFIQFIVLMENSKNLYLKYCNCFVFKLVFKFTTFRSNFCCIDGIFGLIFFFLSGELGLHDF